MASSKLEMFRKQYEEELAKKNDTGTKKNTGGDNASYRFWDIATGATATVRFLPDGNEDNPVFWVERQTIKLPFDGVVGGENPTEARVEVEVPCMNMFVKDLCPVINHIKPWWNKKGQPPNPKHKQAQLYYKKSSFITQGFVVNSPLEEENVPENPIRRFMLGAQLIEKLKSEMADPDREFFPTDYDNGYDFRIKKTLTGDGQNSYNTSGLSLRSRSLSESERLAIETYKLNNLADFRGKRPDTDGIAAIFAMFQASLAGEPYDFDQWVSYGWRPYGLKNSNSSLRIEESDNSSSFKSSSKASDEATDEVVEETKPKSKDIMAQLKAKVASRTV